MVQGRFSTRTVSFNTFMVQQNHVYIFYLRKELKVVTELKMRHCTPRRHSKAGHNFVIQKYCLSFQNCNRREEPAAAPVDTRTHRDKAAHDWKLDEALKRTHNATMISLLSDSDRSGEASAGRRTSRAGGETKGG